LGDAFYVTHDYDNAAAAFRAVGEQYPQSPKVPDALLKLGLTQIDQKKLVDARSTLKQVVQRFPGTDAAKLAASRLQSIPPDEH
jgi:TolA-binding protein